MSNLFKCLNGKRIVKNPCRYAILHVKKTSKFIGFLMTNGAVLKTF